MKEKNLPKIYQVIGIIAFTYAVMLLLLQFTISFSTLTELGFTDSQQMDFRF